MRLLKHSILVVSDYPHFNTSFSEMFHECIVYDANSSRHAVELARTRPFHLYVVNHAPPKLDAVALGRKIRSFDRNTPVLITATQLLDHEVVEAGANAFALLNGDADLLVKKCELLLHQQALRNETARIIEQHAIFEDSLMQARGHLKDVESLIGERKRLIRARAFRCYTSAGGGRVGFVEDWPRIGPTDAGAIPDPR